MNNGQVKISTLFVAAVVTTTLISSIAQAQIRYVDDDAALGGDGLSWGTAYRFLQDSLAEASGNPAISEIRVAQGTYRPDQDEGGNVTPGDRMATFQLIDGVSLMGGFLGLSAGKGEDRDQRNIQLFETILSGDLLGDDAPEDFPSGPTYDNNSYHVVTASNVDETATLDGWTVTAGNANGEPADDLGGGMVIGEGSPTVVRCRFVANAAASRGGAVANLTSDSTFLFCNFEGNMSNRGGGIYNLQSSPTLTGCRLLANTASTAGGGVYNEEGSNPVITGCTFANNAALSRGSTGGGGIYTECGTPKIEQCTFTGNHAKFGGGILNFDGASPVIRECRFTGNTATSQGGGIYSFAFSFEPTNPVVEACLFTANDAPQGGGLHNANAAESTVVACRFLGNTADQGAGMYNQQSTPFIFACEFLDNAAAGQGGGLFSFVLADALLVDCLFAGNSANAGGAVFNYRSSPLLVNCTVATNTASQGGAVANVGTFFFPSEPTLVNCVLFLNTVDQIFDDQPSTTTIQYSDVQGGWPGLGNINADPLFVDPANGDYRLAAGSHCIDAADNTAVPADTLDLDGDGNTTEPIPFDVDGNPRFHDDTGTPDAGNGVPPVVDMGTYEFQGVSPPPCLPADFNSDNVVNVLDLIDLLLCFGQPAVPGCVVEDVNGDGVVNVLDLIQLLLAFGTSCP